MTPISSTTEDLGPFWDADAGARGLGPDDASDRLITIAVGQGGQAIWRRSLP